MPYRDLAPFHLWLSTCRSILVSTLARLHGWSSYTWTSLLVSTPSKCVFGRSVYSEKYSDLPTTKWEQLLFSILVLQEATVPFKFGDLRGAVADSCSWLIPATLLRMCFQAVLWWVTIPNGIHSLSIICNLGFLKCHYFGKLRRPTRWMTSFVCAAQNMDDCSHV